MDPSGAVVARHDYLPFGEEIGAGQAGRGSLWGKVDGVEPKFTGQLRDAETGNDYFNARYYMSGNGRFMSPDWANAGADQYSSQSWKAYAYVGGNPLGLVDPSGMCAAGDTSCFSTTVSTNAGKWWEIWCWFGGPSGDTSWGYTNICSINPSCSAGANGGQTPTSGGGGGTVATVSVPTTNTLTLALDPPKTQKSCTPIARGFGFGVSGGSVGGGGIGPNWSIGGVVSSAYGIFHSPQGWSTGGALTAGGFTTDQGRTGNYPSNNTALPNQAVGFFKGRGGSIFFTNAGNVATLAGQFSRAIIAIPSIGRFPGAQAEVDYSGGVGVVTFGVGNFGVGVMTLQTNTLYTTDRPCS